LDLEIRRGPLKLIELKKYGELTLTDKLDKDSFKNFYPSVYLRLAIRFPHTKYYITCIYYIQLNI